jgi:hypothetical protein
MMIDDQPATQAEAYREMVNNMGQDNPTHCWILTPYDTWERNPAYVGPEQPHPEDDYRLYPSEDMTQAEAFNKSVNKNQNPVDNDCPF